MYRHLIYVPLALLLIAQLAKVLWRVLCPLCASPFIIYFILVFLSASLLTLVLWRHSVLTIVIGFLVGYLAELIGTNYGIPFGEYKYLTQLNLPGGVWIFVPMAWGAFIYITLLASSSLLNPPASLIHAALLTTILDIYIDPLMVHVVKAWKWVNPGPLSVWGTPLTNFAGWFLVSLASLYITYLISRSLPKPSKLYTAPYLAELATYLLISSRETFVHALISLTLGLLFTVPLIFRRG